MGNKKNNTIKTIISRGATMVGNIRHWHSRYMKSQTGVLITTALTGVITLVAILHLDTQIQVIPAIFSG